MKYIYKYYRYSIITKANSSEIIHTINLQTPLISYVLSNAKYDLKKLSYIIKNEKSKNEIITNTK